MENERHEHEVALKTAEREIYEVNRSLATIQATSERQQKEMIALAQEHKSMSKQVMLLHEEKAMIAVEMQNKIERERISADTANREQAS